jgi:radical SAM superfamily enzyme YgiQ (UPF0313 family)
MKKRRVLLFVLPYVVKNIDSSRSKIRSFLAFPYGLLSVATYNKEYADIEIIDLGTFDHPVPIVEIAVQRFKPDIVGFTMMFDNSYRYLNACLEAVRMANLECLTVLGGAAASYSYQEILDEQPHLDAICYSEGEVPLRDLLESASPFECLDDHPSWVTRESIRRFQVPRVSYIENLDEVIDIDYSFVDGIQYDMQEAFSPYANQIKDKKQFFLVTSRGCPFKCTFCSNATIHGKQMRFASVAKIIEHVDDLVNQYGMNVLTIYDDQLLIHPPRAKELFRRLAPYGLRIECPNGLSPAFIDEEMARLMHDAGLDTAYLAIESGSEYVLNTLIKKPLKLEQVKPAVDALHHNGIFVHGFFVVGMPGETDEMRQETVNFIREVDLDWAGFNPATPVRGSVLYDECISKGWIKKQRIGEIEDKKYIINVPGVDPKHVIDSINDMNRLINFEYNRSVRVGNWWTAQRCFEEVLARYEGHQLAKRMIDFISGGEGE